MSLNMFSAPASKGCGVIQVETMRYQMGRFL
ncbi:MAG: hypothetical protein ACI8SK_000825 [Shewanella sp.]|jgi:hypothetical protein